MDRELMYTRLNQLVEANKKNELRGALLMLNVVDIAEYMEELPSDKLLMVFRILPKDIAADVFAYIDSDQQQQLIQLIRRGTHLHAHIALWPRTKWACASWAPQLAACVRLSQVIYSSPLPALRRLQG